MSRIPADYDNPIDYWCYQISEWVSPYLRSFQATPNQITTWSLCVGLVSAYALSQKTEAGVYWFAGLYLVQFLLDCLDGYYARRYGMISEVGDWYDHIKDVVLYFLICYILVSRYGLPRYLGAMAVVVLLPILQYVYNGCVSVYRSQSHTAPNVSPLGQVSSMTLGEKMCPHRDDPHALRTNLARLRWVGPGTCAVGLCVVAIYLFYQTRETGPSN